MKKNSPNFQKLDAADLFINSAAVNINNEQAFSEFLMERRKKENAKSKAIQDAKTLLAGLPNRSAKQANVNKAVNQIRKKNFD